MHDPDFHLASSEGYYMEEPKQYRRARRFAVGKRNGWLLLRIDPTFVGQHDGLGGQDVEEVLATSRHKGDSLLPITQWPVFVHVARPLLDMTALDEIQFNQIRLMAWAALYQTEQHARLKVM